MADGAGGGVPTAATVAADAAEMVQENLQQNPRHQDRTYSSATSNI